ncbi:MAG: 3,4-dihydroxy 2-butanone 4-phosphate synthase/GTP cyclohydrolase II [Rhodothermales bacterium]|jgi:3,4-dihydroxy 2-butanone 4-phosphate synthase/GTP cyclohydrolase II
MEPDNIETVIDAVRRGEIVVITDDAARENEGDLVMAADKVTPDAVNFMARFGRGLICAPIEPQRAHALGLSQMAPTKDRFNTAFTLSVDAREGITTGISAADRARTIALLADDSATREDFDVPGHIFPLTAKENGVLERPGHTEAAVDLARLADCTPAGVICEIMEDDGSMMRLPALGAYAKKHGLKWGTIADLIAYRHRHQAIVCKNGSVKMPTRYSKEDFDLHCYVSKSDNREHIALVYGDVKAQDSVLVRVHSECLTGDVFHSARCDCGEQLELALERIVIEGSGIVVYLRQEGRGIGLIKKLEAYRLQDQGLDTVEANERLGFAPDLREYSAAAQMLIDLGVARIRLMTNNPEKVQGITEFGLQITERIPIVVPPKAENAFYLKTKRDRLGHLL